VSLKIIRLFEAQSSIFVRRANQFFLCRSRRKGDAGCFAILVDACAADDSPDDITVLQGLRQRLDDDHNGALSSRIAVGAMVKGVTLAVRTEEVERSHASVRTVRLAPTPPVLTKDATATHICISGMVITLVPPTRACFDSPLLRLWQARCNATRLEEHAVSKLRLGPFKLKNQESLLLNIAAPLPVPSYRGIHSGSRDRILA
jgi:hypothetical protein